MSLFEEIQSQIEQYKDIDSSAKYLGIFLFFMFYVWFWLPFFVIMFFLSDLTSQIIITFIFIFLSITLQLTWIIFISYLVDFYKITLNKIYSMNEIIHNKSIWLSSINECLDQINEIKLTINKWRNLKYIIWFACNSSANQIYQTFLQSEVLFLISILTDLRSDLSIRLAEQEQILESAKSEVEKNIQWTTELNKVSELQRARLDRQIEQFEELQRVLIRV